MLDAETLRVLQTAHLQNIAGGAPFTGEPILCTYTQLAGYLHRDEGQLSTHLLQLYWGLCLGRHPGTSPTGA